MIIIALRGVNFRGREKNQPSQGRPQSPVTVLVGTTRRSPPPRPRPQTGEMARSPAVEVKLSAGRTLVIHAPEPVAGSPGGGPIMPTIAGDSLVLVEPDPDVDLLRSG